VIGNGTPMLPMRTSLSTRSGCWVTTRSAIAPPKLLPTSDAVRMSSASRKPVTWSAQTWTSYPMPSGRSV
jgi:hypothetical protein